MGLNLHPKVKWAALIAVLATAGIGAAEALGHPLPPWLAGLIVTVVGSVTGYSVSSPEPAPLITTGAPLESHASASARSFSEPTQ